jgi:hypothetical protein
MKLVKIILSVFVLNIPLSGFSQGELPPSAKKVQISIHGGLGWANFARVSTLNYNRSVFMPNGGIQGRFFLSDTWAILGSLDYMSLGASSPGIASTLTDRLRTLQLSGKAEKRLTHKTSPWEASLSGGLFTGRFTQIILFYEQPGNPSGQTIPIGTFDKWNAGITVGGEVGKPITDHHTLSAYANYDIGLLNILAPTTTQGTSAYTRAVRIGLAFTF